MNRRLMRFVIAWILLMPCMAFAQQNPWAPACASAKPSTGVVVFFREKKYMGGGVPFKVREGT